MRTSLVHVLTLTLTLTLSQTLPLTLSQTLTRTPTLTSPGYVAQYTKELASNEATLRLLNQGRAPQQHAEAEEDPAQKRQRV